MKEIEGVISQRKDGNWGVICSQCHHLIKNEGENCLNIIRFECDRCHKVNIVKKKEIKNGKFVNDWTELMS